MVAPRQFELRDWIKESDRQEQQIGAAANAMCWREIVDVEFEILQAAKRQAIAGQCILDIAQARYMRRQKYVMDRLGDTPKCVVGLQLVAIAPQAVKRAETTR